MSSLSTSKQSNCSLQPVTLELLAGSPPSEALQTRLEYNKEALNEQILRYEKVSLYALATNL